MFTPGGGGYGKPEEHKDKSSRHLTYDVASSGSLGQYKQNQEST